MINDKKFKMFQINLRASSVIGKTHVKKMDTHLMYVHSHETLYIIFVFGSLSIMF